MSSCRIVFILPINNNITKFVYSRAGYVEHLAQPGEAVSSFKISDLENNKLAWVHQQGTVAGVSFRAWDGEDFSQTLHLKIQVDTLSTSTPHLHTTLACACELSTAFYSAKTSNQLFIVLFPSVMCHFVIFFIRAFNKRWKFNFSVFLTQCKYIGRIEKLCSECSRVNEVKADLKTISH